MTASAALLTADRGGVRTLTLNRTHRKNAINPEHTGTKCAAHYELNVGAGKTASIRVRLSNLAPAAILRRISTR